ncbi:MAG: 16S rRNA (guanine(527)-N(7))-methyltransferase RsmG [Gammaproteobacteria bacterium]|nr:16S rRNA (guanine(527)-N(7))-methyltransferase RsmG [Gammaproteobacteria bacterium]
MQDNINKDLFFFKKNLNVCEKKMQIFMKYIKLLDVYQTKVNLIGKSTRDKIWSRHILDSAQILKLLPNENKGYSIIDVGTGAGLPGLVLTILGRNDIILCENNYKKVIFLSAVIKECQLKVQIFKGKIESYKNKNTKIIVSRAFAPLKFLLKSIKHMTNADTILVIHKGEKYLEELELARKYYTFTAQCYDSITNPLAKIVKIKNIIELNE